MKVRDVAARRSAVEATVWAATLCSFAMIANQIAGKAVRDAMFLSTFGIESLPRIVILSSALSLLVVLLASRMLRRHGSNRLVPAAFGVSALILLLISGFYGTFPRAAAAGLYLHIAVFGAILVSWFWLLLNERLDVRTARTHIARIAGGGTLGGLVGGLLAERVGAMFSAGAMLPVLAGLHVICAYLATRIVTSASSHRNDFASAPNDSGKVADLSETGRFGFRILWRSDYLRNLALLVFLGTLGASLLDFSFKLYATQSYVDARSLLRFFAGFYTITALLTFVLQNFFVSRFLKSPRDLSRNVSLLPLGVLLGGLVSLLLPSLAVLALARGLENVVRNSFFRSSYEVLFNPISALEKRATKTLIDVGLDRFGDFIGGLVVQGTLFFVAASVGVPFLLVLTLLVAALAAWRAKQLHSGYVEALEGLIRDRVPANTDAHTREQMTQTMFASEMGTLHPQNPTLGLDVTGFWSPEDLSFLDRPETGPAVAIETDPEENCVAELGSKDIARVTRALETTSLSTRELIQAVVLLLAWDPAYKPAATALRRVVQDKVDLLIESMVDPTTAFAIRRRLPLIIATGTSPKIVAGLLQALRDKRFEVRYRAAIALSRIHRRAPDLIINRDIVLDVISSESRVGRRMWEKRRLLDRSEDADDTLFYRDVLRDRTHRSMDHVFHLLALIFAKEPLRVAYDGLHTEDRTLRATALEYLESILPERIRRSLLPLLGGSDVPRNRPRPEGELLDSLLLSHASIVLELNKLGGLGGRKSEEE